MTAALGHATDTSLKKLTLAAKKIALGYLSAASEAPQTAETQIAGISSTCLRDVHYMSEMTKAFGSNGDRNTRAERVTAQVRQVLSDLTSHAHVSKRGGEEGEYLITYEGRQLARTLSGARR